MNPPIVVADRYEILRPLGRGSFAHTLLARDRQLRREVALKVLHARADDLKAYDLFEREAAVLRGLTHHGIPRIHASFRAEWEGRDAAFLVMEYIEGVSVAEWIAERRHLEPEAVQHLFVSLLEVLEYLHSRVPPVLHRDIKPANLIIRPDGSPALVDFGAVRNVFRSPDDDGSTVVGTYGYMPYEQYMGQASPASDLYALGATFLHLLTGRAPPEFMSAAGRLEVPASLPGGLQLRMAIARLLAPAQADRYQSAREVKASFTGAVGGAVVMGTKAALDAPVGTELVLGPTPREIEGEMVEMLDSFTYSGWELMDSSTRGDGRDYDVGDWLLFAFFCVVTVGVMPAVFFGMAGSRRKRVRRFLIEGLPVIGRVRDMQLESTAFGEKLMRVRYEFDVGDVEGSRHRGSDLVLPRIAENWDPGDSIALLYIPETLDSIVISTR